MDTADDAQDAMGYADSIARLGRAAAARGQRVTV
jgi:hypothetical protein